MFLPGDGLVSPRRPSVPPVPLCLTNIVCSWTIVYDTIYACQDREDDIQAGIKSTAVLFGKHVREILIVFTIAFLMLMTFAGWSNQQSIGYFAISCAGSAAHFAWIFWSWNVDVPEDGGAKFQVRCYHVVNSRRSGSSACPFSRMASRASSSGLACFSTTGSIAFASDLCSPRFWAIRR